MNATAHVMLYGSWSVDVGDLKGKEAAELVFAKLNHGSGQTMEGYEARSMMVGDVVEVGDEALRCSMVGWEPVRWNGAGKWVAR